MKKIFTNITVAAMFIFLFATMAVMPLSAQEIGLNYAGEIGLQQASESDPRVMAASIVKYLMTFLGIIAVVVILLGGFKWMTAAGNEDKVGEAKKLIIAGIIGLIIILAAYAIVTFVFQITTSALNGDITEVTP